MSISQKKKIFTEKHRLNLSLAQKGKKKRPISNEHKLKLSMAHKGKVFSEKHLAALSGAATRKPVRQLDHNTGEIIKTFRDQKQAGQSIGLKTYTTIGAVCRGEQKTAGGYRWEYITEDIPS